MKKILLGVCVLGIGVQASAQQYPAFPIPVDAPLARSGDDTRAVTDTLFGPSLMSNPNISLVFLASSQTSNDSTWTGTNALGTTATAQRIDIEEPIIAEGIIGLYMAREKNAEAPQVKLSLRGMTNSGVIGVNGQTPIQDPSAPNVASYVEVDLPLAEIDTTNLTVKMFDAPVYVPGSFGIVVDHSTVGATGAAFGVIVTHPDQSSASMEHYVWLQYQGVWISSTALLEGNSYDLVLGVLVDASSVGIGSTGTYHGMRMDIAGANPANDRAEVVFEHTKSTQSVFRVLDMNGRVVMEEALGQVAPGIQRRVLDVSNWAAGTYVVSVTANGVPLSKRLVVAH